MSQASDLFGARAVGEEGRKRYAYNDATGKTVTCQPAGNLSIGIGVNLEMGLDDEEIEWLFRHRVGLVEERLQSYSWYAQTDPVRQSVFLDVAFNAGVSGLLQFQKMIAAAGSGDWPTAALQLLDSSAARQLPQRYNRLASILLSGTA